MFRRTYALVDLDKIAHNIEQLHKCAKTDVLAVVKADAYGHGMIPVAKKALACGVRHMAVATPEEALDLREQCAEPMILILSHTEKGAYPSLIEKDISLCAFEVWHLQEIAEAAAAQGKRAKVHIKLDTGMGRIGLRSDKELREVLDFLKEHPKQIEMEGLFTHFATADEADRNFTEQQLAKYVHWRKMVLEAGFAPICHASNSAATIGFEGAHFDLCRMGISMYGYMPAVDMPGQEDLQPALSLYSYVSHVKTIHAGDTVSYGRLFTAKKDTRVATVPIGYADGYRRGLGNKASAIINGKLVPLIGRVCMDQIMFDVSDVEAKPGDTVVLIGEQDGRKITADDLAELCGTISYEILSCLTARVPRIYKNA